MGVADDGVDVLRDGLYFLHLNLNPGVQHLFWVYDPLNLFW